MVIENASTHAVAKPWGRTDLRPWRRNDREGARIGEIWFGRDGLDTDRCQLLLKFLFTSEPLSIQVHPDDLQAQAMGEPHGKTEAWYVLAADADARVALGPDRTLTDADLRGTVDAGRISDIIRWWPATAGDVFVVPAGTIHAIGAGLAIVEIQQRSDITYRLFDYGRPRGLQVDSAVAVACLSPATAPAAAITMGEGRSAIAVTPFFVLEHLDFADGSNWDLEVDRETWLLVLGGDIEIAGVRAGIGEAIYLEDERSMLVAGVRGAVLLAAYAGDRPEPDFLRPRPVPVAVPSGKRTSVVEPLVLRSARLSDPAAAEGSLP